MQKDARNLLAHTGVYLLARGLPGVIAFLAIPLFTRVLDPAQYGRYALVMGAVGMLNALLFQWQRLSLVRYLPAYKDSKEQLQSTLAASALILVAGVGVIGAALCCLPLGNEFRIIVLASWCLLTVQAMYDLVCEYSRASVRPWNYMVLQMARAISAVGLGVILTVSGLGWWGPLAGLGIGMGLASAWSWRQDWKGVRLSIDRRMLMRICQYGVPLSLTVALSMVIGTSDRFLIRWLMSESDAGRYAVAYDFTAQTLTLVMLVVNMAMFPLAVRAWESGGPEAAREPMRANAAILMAIGLPCVIGMTVLAPGVANCFFGKDFRSAAVHIIPLIALGTFIANLKGCHFDAAFQFAHRTIYQVWIVLFAAVVNLGLNAIAIPRWGINGAAVASALAYIIAIGLTVYFGRRHFAVPFPPVPSIQVIFAGAAMALALWPLRSNLSPAAFAGQVAGGAAVYAGALVAFNFLGFRDALTRKLTRSRAMSDARPQERKRQRDVVVAPELAVAATVAETGSGALL